MLFQPDLLYVVICIHRGGGRFPGCGVRLDKSIPWLLLLQRCSARHLSPSACKVVSYITTSLVWMEGAYHLAFKTKLSGAADSQWCISLVSLSNRLNATQQPSKAAHASSAPFCSVLLSSPLLVALLSSTDAQSSLCPSCLYAPSLAFSDMTNIHHVFLPARLYLHTQKSILYSFPCVSSYQSIFLAN